MTHHPVALIILRSEAESFNLLQSAFSADISIWKSNEIKLLFYDPLELCGSHTCHLLQIDRLKPSQSDWFIDGTWSVNFEFGRTFCFFRQLGGQVRSHLDKGGGVTDAPDLWTVLHSTLSTAVIAVPTELYEFFQGNAVCPQMAIASVGIDRWGPPAQRGSLLRNDVTQFICLRHQVLERSASSSYVFFF